MSWTLTTSGMTLSQREDTVKFEQGRIKALQEERIHIQKKTFTKWVNSYLQKARLEVEDLFTDLADGKKLLKLLEIISGEKLGKPNHGRMRVHKVENVNKSLAFLHTKVRLESIGAEDIVDGNPRLILGLIWTIILRFQIQEIEIDVDEDNESSEKKSAKDALLLWCQRKTAGYQGVNINDFSVSWRNGLGFNALIHSHRPDVLNYNALVPQNHIDNLNNAFDIAQRELGIPRLLDAEDVDTNKPDEKSVITYVASYYHTFARMKNEMKGGRRIANIVAQMMESDKLKNNYETYTTTLLDWIKQKISELNDRKFPNSLEGIQRELLKFKEYRTIEKPLKYQERSDIEALLFAIQTKQKALGQPLYIPAEGKLAHDIEKAWDSLEKAEHLREIDLREELVRQEKLANLAYRFERKSVLRENYLKEMIQVLSDPRYGSNMSQVEATVKKHEAISADILAREERFHNLTAMADELVKENYHGREKIKKRECEILEKWRELLELLKKHRFNLTNFSKLMSMLREIDTITDEIKEMKGSLLSDEYGRHLLSVEDLIQKHSLVEAHITSQGETINKLNKAAIPFIKEGVKEAPILQDKLNILNNEYDSLKEHGKLRREKLEESRVYYQFVRDHEEEDAWVIESQRICKAVVGGKDLLGAISLQQKHKSLEDEMQTRFPRSQRVTKVGEQLIAKKHPQSLDVKERIEELNTNWEHLHQLAKLKQKQLEDILEAHQYHADANEAESWMREKMPIVSSTDYGSDEPSAQALLQRHSRQDEEIKAYSDDIERLNEQAERMIKSGIASINIFDSMPEEPEPEEWVEEVVMTPVEEWVEEIIQREVTQDVVEDRPVQQVKALYNFTGQGMEMQKAEIMILLQKTNSDWWNVRKSNGRDGFVPASYVKEIDPKIVKKVTKKTVKVPEKKRVKKTVLKPQVVRNKRPAKTSPNRSEIKGKPLKRSNSGKVESESVEQRQEAINATYNKLIHHSQERKLFLDDSIKLFGFYSECDDFESWMKDKEKMLTTHDPTESVEVMKKKFENFLTDLSASSRRIANIDALVEEFTINKHSQLPAIKSRQKQIHDRYNKLNKLKTDKERSLEGATGVELFNRTCDEARDWMMEKVLKMESDEIGRDMKTVQALQRKHQNLERELAPVEEKFNRVNLLADSVKVSYPSERKNVTARQKELQELWDTVKAKAAERKSRLDESLGLQIFRNGAKSLLVWVSEVKQKLNNDEPARDVVTAENLLKDHGELEDDIKAHQDEFADIQELGTKLLHQQSPEVKEVETSLVQLQEEQDAIHRGWTEKGDWLRQCMDLQLFNREADQIDSITNSHDAFLDYADLGTTLDDVEGLLKRHENFINTLVAQHDRLRSFSEMADKLIVARHYESKYIDERRHQVLARRQVVRDKALQRKELLLASHLFQEFKAEADEVAAWIQEKLKTAADESYRDLTNLERKLQKHEAFEAELKANEARILVINDTGKGLMLDNHYATEDIQSILERLNRQWEELRSLTIDKGHKLRQAVAQHTYNRTLEDARTKLEELQNALSSDDIGHDLRSVKDLMVKHSVLENEIATWETKVDDLSKLGADMAEQGHFDAPNILKATKGVNERLAKLKGPAKERRHKLEESLKLHQFNFEVDTELQWIREHGPLATSADYGQSLFDSQNLYKKHQKLEREIEGHQPMIDKTIATGEVLVAQRHFAKDIVQSKSEELKEKWIELSQQAAERKKNLDLSLKAQHFFSEANEVELWMNEKIDILSSNDYGKDEDASIKLLTKHKALELEIDTYSGLVTEIGTQAQKMVDDNHPDAKVISNRMQVINQGLRNLQKLANVRRQKLMEVKNQHEYFRESDEFEQWINEEMQTAMSDDYGQDYEHLLILHSKFDDFRHRVEAGEDRYNQIEDLSKKLISGDSPYSGEVEKRQEQLGQAWHQLLEHIKARDQKLQAAGEIHRFNRDVSEAQFRIQEKYSSIPTDLGKDLRSVQSLIRKHDGFENDLVALEAQLQVIVDDSVRLQSAYPGGNAEHIQEQQNIIVENWNTLQDRCTQRHNELDASLQLQRILAQARDLETWASGVCSSLQTEEKVRDVAAAQMLKVEHERLKAEIEAREDNFSSVMEEGQNLIDSQHYASEEVRDKLQQLLQVRENLHQVWQRKKEYFDQLESLQWFQRDAKQLDTLSSQQEVYLGSFDVGTTVEEVAIQVKKHEEFEKLMNAQDEKLAALQDQGTKLIQQNHFASDIIRNRIDEVTSRRNKVKEMSKNRKQRLADALMYAQFRRDAGEAETWINDKKMNLDVEEAKAEVTSLEDKMKKLQKHQAFKAELTAHKDSIIGIKETGERLLAKRHEAAPEIHSQLEHLLGKWNQLLDASASRGRGLEEAQDILEFNNQSEQVLAWIRDKEMMVQAGETGEDYEHCLALQRKLNDVDSDMRVDETRIKNVNSLAEKVIRQGRSDTRSLQQRRDDLIAKWRSLQGALDQYREKLAAALEIHGFNRDVDDTDDRINEKVSSLSIEDEAKNLQTVEALQRKQETTEMEIAAIEKKLKEHDSEAKKLVQKYPEMASPIRKKVNHLQENWRRLTNMCQTKKHQLASAYTLQKFLSDHKELEIWVTEMIKRMTSGELASNIPEAQSMLQLHEERKAEIDGRQEVFRSLKEYGHALLQQKHKAKDTLEESLLQLEEMRMTLTQAWEARKHQLTQCLELQIFKEQAEQCDSWLASKEAFLNNEDLGDSMSSVEGLLRKHENFEKTMVAQADRVEQFESSTMVLLAAKHYDSAAIQSRCSAIIQRRDRLKEGALVRKKKLQESKQLQQFLRNTYEVVGWIHEKMQVATDESYRDPTNLLTKIQKHTAFDAELSANKGRVDAVLNEGEKLIGAGHFASMEIQTKIQELEALWQQLQDNTKLKKERLQDAYQALLVTRMFDDLDHWMDDVENQLQSEDHGKDLTSVQNLLKKHQQLETDINNHAENIEQVKDLAASFQTCDHFMKDEIQEKSLTLVNRYQSLHEPMQIRRENLEDALLLYQFYRDIEDEILWIREKEPLASSAELGNSLNAVQNLQKKHAALESEIHSHEPLIATVSSKGRQMIRSNHYASNVVETKLQELHGQVQALKDMGSVRRLRLLDAVESQTFYSEASEAESWMKEKKPALLSPDLGRDEDSVQSLLKKLDGLDRDIDNFQTNVLKLSKLSQGLIERGHFDSENIRIKQAEVEAHYQELQCLVDERERKLIESKKLFAFLRECDEVSTWIQDQMVAASSEDYGKDVEHVEILIQKFEAFTNNLQSNEDRITLIKNTSKSLINENHPQSELIKSKSSEISKLWKNMNDITHSRQEALMGAKQVHTFDRSADETICWIHEKQSTLLSEDYGHDLESIQALIRHHEGFERDLAAVKEQVVMLVEEARRLATQFPDAREHIEAKHEEVSETWNQLLENSASRNNRLSQAEQLQAYFDEYRELMAWASETMALITSSELGQDVAGAEALLDRHKEYKAEIDTRLDAFSKFHDQGEALIAEGHFMADEIREKVQRLDRAIENLLQTWNRRQLLYEQSLDTQLFKRDADQLEAWIQSRQPILRDNHYGDSIVAVEELIRKHEDFQKTIEAQDDKFSALKRITKLEEAFRRLKMEEEEQKKLEVSRREQERVDAMKKKEQQRILQERKREDERRRTQEIVFNVSDDTEMTNGKAEVPEIRPHGLMFRAASQKSLNDTSDKTLSPMMRVGSMRVESLTPAKKDNLLGVKRSESFKLDERTKKPKRTPSFTTRRRATAASSGQNRARSLENLPPVDIEGFLDRKQELQSGSKRATIRSWKTHYTVLCGQLLCFFKDKDGFIDNQAAAPPVNLLQAKCSRAVDYTKKKHVFRVQISDGAEFLFMATDEKNLQEWLDKISFHASLPPSMQLLSYDAHIKARNTWAAPDLPDTAGNATSSASSRTSSPESNRNATGISQYPDGGKRQSPNNSPPKYNAADEPYNSSKPPIPPRIPLNRGSSEAVPFDNRVSVKSRIQQFQPSPTRPAPIYTPGSSPESGPSYSAGNHQNGVNNGVSVNNGDSIPEDSGVYEKSVPINPVSPPPLPDNPPPNRGKPRVEESDDDLKFASDSEQERQLYRQNQGNRENASFRQSYQDQKGLPSQANVVRHMSLPPKSMPPGGYHAKNSGTLDTRHRTPSSDGSSEGELYSNEKKTKKKGVFHGLFKKNRP